MPLSVAAWARGVRAGSGAGRAVMVQSVNEADFDAVLFDLDGVVTDTASVHQRAWTEMFDSYLESRAERRGEPFAPFARSDYLEHVDGKPRYDGVRDFLRSRHIELPEGSPDSDPGEESVGGLGNAKNALVRTMLERDGVTVFDGTVGWLDDLRAAGVRVAVVSSSRDCSLVLQAAGLEDRFEAQVDGLVAAEMGLQGKPAPDTYLEAAARVNASAERSVVVEDARSGVEAGRAGSFGLVIGVDRGDNRAALLDGGADIVVDDLSEMRQ